MRKTWFVAGACLALAPAALYLGVVAHYAANIPRGDDYTSLFPFLCDWIETPSPARKLSLLFAQYFSHRIVLTKCAALVQFLFSGHCDLRWLLALGAACWLALAIWLPARTPAVRAAPWCALPVFLLLMQPQGYTNFHSAMQAVQNLGIVLVAFAALAAALTPARGGYLAGLALAAVAPFTSANGLLVFPVATVALLILQRRRRALGFAVAGLLVGGGYFAGFVVPPEAFAWRAFLMNAAVMAGGPADLGRAPLLVVAVAGAVLLATAGATLLRANPWRMLPLHSAFLLFLLLTIALAARGRVGWGAGYMLQDRYRLYGMLVLAVLYLLALELAPSVRRRAVALAGVLMAGVFCLLSYSKFLPPMLTSARWSEATAMNRQLGREFLLPSGPGWSEPLAALARAERLGVYRYPGTVSAGDVALLRQLATVAAAPPAFHATPNGAVLGAMLTLAAPEPKLIVPEFAAVAIPGRPLILPADVWRTRLADLPEKRTFFSAAFGLIWPAEAYQPGRYAVHGLSRGAGGRLQVLWSVTADCPPLPR